MFQFGRVSPNSHRVSELRLLVSEEIEIGPNSIPSAFRKDAAAGRRVSVSSNNSTFRNSMGWLSALQRDRASGDHLGLPGVEEFLGVGLVRVKLRLAVFEHRLAVDLVANESLPWTSISAVTHWSPWNVSARAVGAVLRVELAIVDDVGAGRAEVGGRCGCRCRRRRGTALRSRRGSPGPCASSRASGRGS